VSCFGVAIGNPSALGMSEPLDGGGGGWAQEFPIHHWKPPISLASTQKIAWLMR